MIHISIGDAQVLACAILLAVSILICLVTVVAVVRIERVTTRRLDRILEISIKHLHSSLADGKREAEQGCMMLEILTLLAGNEAAVVSKPKSEGLADISPRDALKSTLEPVNDDEDDFDDESSS